MKMRAHIVAVAVVVAACGDGLGPISDVGSLTFEYDGAETGAFATVGARPADWATRPHAAGQWLDDPVMIRVFAITESDQFFLVGHVSGPGTYPIVDPTSSVAAFSGELALDVERTENQARVIYVLDSGTVTVEPLRNGRIRGRFEGTAHRLDGTETIRITRGRFDVPTTLDPPVAALNRVSRRLPGTAGLR